VVGQKVICVKAFQVNPVSYKERDFDLLRIFNVALSGFAIPIQSFRRNNLLLAVGCPSVVVVSGESVVVVPHHLAPEFEVHCA